MTGLVKVLLVVDDEPRNVVSFAKTLSGSLRTIRIRGRQPRAEPETGRPASSHLSRLETSSAGVAVAPRLVQPSGVAARIFAAGDVEGPKTRRPMSGSRQATRDRSQSRTFSSTEDRGR